MATFHQSVLAEEVAALLQISASTWYLDATLGDGGHASLIRAAGGRLIGLDLDVQALTVASKRLEVPSAHRGGDTCPLGACWASSAEIKLFRANFIAVADIIAQLGLTGQVSGAIYDLGYSNRQYDTAGLGLSYRHLEDYLDMRLDPSLTVTASQLLNSYSIHELAAVFSQLGEDKFARPLADRIVSTRQLKPIRSVGQLVNIINQVKPAGAGRRIHPATQAFQALRMEVNREIENLAVSLNRLWPGLASGARLAVISFHSLEDRTVKNMFKRFAAAGQGKLITKKPLTPGPGELADNPRSRSAKLRVIEKT